VGKKDFAWVKRTVSGMGIGGASLLSRVAFSHQIDGLIGGPTRAIIEHGAEAFGLQIFFSGIFLSSEILQAMPKKDRGERERWFFVFMDSSLALMWLGWEILQAVDRKQPVQWEQLAGSVVGVGLGLAAVGLMNMMDKKKEVN